MDAPTDVKFEKVTLWVATTIMDTSRETNALDYILPCLTENLFDCKVIGDDAEPCELVPARNEAG